MSCRSLVAGSMSRSFANSVLVRENLSGVEGKTCPRQYVLCLGGVNLALSVLNHVHDAL